MMASGSNEMKRKSTDDGGVSPPPLRRKVQSMTTRKLCFILPISLDTAYPCATRVMWTS